MKLVASAGRLPGRRAGLAMVSRTLPRVNASDAGRLGTR
jgi:hypothetical protein